MKKSTVYFTIGLFTIALLVVNYTGFLFSKKPKILDAVSPPPKETFVPVSAKQRASWAEFDKQMLADVGENYFDDLNVDYKGPFNIGGRTKAILVDQSNPDRIFAGGDTGGVFRSIDGGQNWTPVDEHLDDFSIKSIIQNPLNPDIIYFSNKRDIYKSTDSGDTFNKVQNYNISESYNIQLVHSTVELNTLYAVSVYFPDSEILRSVNGGESWESIYNINKIISRMTMLPAGKIIIAAHDGVYTSEYDNISFQLVQAFPIQVDIARLAYCEDLPNHVYAASIGVDGIQHLYYSSTSGDSWNEMNAQPVPGLHVPHFLSLGVKKDDPNIIFLGAVPSFYSVDGGNTWEQTSAGHVDQHEFVNHPTNPLLVFLGNDGGVWKHTWWDMESNPGQPPIDLNGGDFDHTGYGTTQFYRGDIDHEGRVIGGMQDNGTQFYEGGIWSPSYGADGFSAHFHHQDNSKLYVSTQEGKVYRQDDIYGAFETVPLITDGDDMKNPTFHTYFINNKADGDQLYYEGVDNVWRSTNQGDTWEEIEGSGGTSTRTFNLSNEISPTLYSINSPVIYKLENADVAPANQAELIEGKFPYNGLDVSCLVVHPENFDEILVSYNSQIPVIPIWKINTSDDSEPVSYSDGLPTGLGVRTIAYNPSAPHHILAGTPHGVYETMYGSNWIKIPDIPNVRVEEIKANGNGKFGVFTYGRGAWTLIREDILDGEFTTIPHKENFGSSLILDPLWKFESTGQLDQISSTSWDGYEDYTSQGKLVFDCYSIASKNSAAIRLNLKEQEGPVNVSFVRKVTAGAGVNPTGSVLVSTNGGLDYKRVYTQPLDTEFTYHSFDLFKATNEEEIPGRKVKIEFTEWVMIKFEEDQNPGDLALIDNLSINNYNEIPLIDGFEGGTNTYNWETRTNNSKGFVSTPSIGAAFEGQKKLRLMTSGINNELYSLNEALLRLNLKQGGGLTLKQEEDVSLSFYYKESLGELDLEGFGVVPLFDDGVYFSNDGGATFEKIGNFPAVNNYTFVYMNLSQLAAEHDLTFTDRSVIKFLKYQAPEEWANIDNVIVENVYRASFPYSYGFEEGLPEEWELQSNNEGRIRLTDIEGPASGTKHLLMDDEVNNPMYSYNSALLRIDLANVSSAELSFDWKSIHDEILPPDGVYLSDDDGATFTKVFGFDDFSDLGDPYIYQHYQEDLIQLIDDYGLYASKMFVIKFQQYDNYGVANDGIAIDNVSIDYPLIGGLEAARYLDNPATPVTPTTLVYPNPSVDGLFNLGVTGYNNSTDRTSIKVFDINGRTVYQDELTSNSTSIDLSDQPKGIYTLVVTYDNNQVEHKKIIINK